jgi:outer membrane protein
MRKQTIALLVTLVASFSTSAMAADFKIAVVDVRQALQKSPQMTSATADLDKQFKSRQQNLVDEQKDLQADTMKLNKEGAVMKNEDRIALQDKIVSKQKKVQSDMASFKQDLEAAQGQAMQKIVTKFTNVVTKIAEKNGYQLVLSRDATPYFKPEFDITSQVSQALSKE